MKANKDLFSTILNQLWRIVSGPMLLLVIPTYLTPIEQGYWYTFISISTLSIFADLGFSTILLQFSAHEFAYLKFDDDYTLSGDKWHLDRLAAFLKFAVKWLSKIIIVVFPLIMVGGFLFIKSNAMLDGWQIPWVIYSFFSGINFFASSILCFFEGCNSVSRVQVIRFKTAVCTTCTMVFGLLIGINLYALSFSMIVLSLSNLYYIYKLFKVPILQLWKHSKHADYDWWPEFSGLIWRYAISWCSGYFIFQLFTPLAFYFHGPVMAGKVGISIAAWTAGYNIANSWMVAITPKLNMLVSEQNWKQLDELFDKNFLYSVITMLGGGITYFVLYCVCVDKIEILSRFLPPSSMLVLFLCWLCQVIVNNWALYLRAHKKEPLMLISAISAIYVAIGTFFCGKYLESNYLFLGFFSSYIWGIPIVHYIWRMQRKGHKDNI